MRALVCPCDSRLVGSHVLNPGTISSMTVSFTSGAHNARQVGYEQRMAECSIEVYDESSKDKIPRPSRCVFAAGYLVRTNTAVQIKPLSTSGPPPSIQHMDSCISSSLTSTCNVKALN
jgi:hypothetical protein